MAKGVQFRPDSNGFRALLNGGDCQAVLLTKAQKVEASATRLATYRGAAYSSDVRPGKNRAHARVKSTTAGGYWAALKQKTLTSALGNGRG